MMPRVTTSVPPGITHPEKVLFPDSGVTKGELAAYYESIASIMLPHISRRPITMERYPAGIDKKGFWQKDVSKGFPDWLERVEVPKKDGTVHHPLVTDVQSLLWVTNQNTVTQHVWTSRAPNLYYPDVCVFDLDPSTENEPAVLRAAALALRDLLTELGLPSRVKTSGSKGFHIVVPLDGKTRMGEVARFAHVVGALLVRRDPQHLTQEFSKADRGGRIFVDTGRNGYSATFAAAYTVRAKPGAPVSAPCTWEEIERGAVGPRTFTLRTMTDRVAQVGDLWAGMYKAANRASRSSKVKASAGGSSLRRPIERLRRKLKE
jgi:bifunctional non-homologous end joining protein LigD